MEAFDKEPAISAIVGGTDKQKDAAKLRLKQLFNDQNEAFRVDTEGFVHERVKTPEETAIIEEVLRYLPDFIRSYGGKPVDATSGHVHMLDTKKSNLVVRIMMKLTSVGGMYRPENQTVLIDGQSKSMSSRLALAHGVAHEFIHMNSFTSLGIVDDSNDSVKLRRIGLTIGSDDSDKLFYYLNEAVTEELAQCFAESIFGKIDLLKDEFQSLVDYKKNNSDAKDAFVTGTIAIPPGVFCMIELKYSLSSYSQQREEFRKLVKDLYGKNPNKFDSEGDVFRLFAEAMLAGKIVPLVKIYEKTYGKGSFRVLGEKMKR